MFLRRAARSSFLLLVEIVASIVTSYNIIRITGNSVIRLRTRRRVPLVDVALKRTAIVMDVPRAWYIRSARFPRYIYMYLYIYIYMHIYICIRLWAALTREQSGVHEIYTGALNVPEREETSVKSCLPSPIVVDTGVRARVKYYVCTCTRWHRCNMHQSGARG